MRFIRGILGLALALLFTAFAVANRQTVEITWSPLHPAASLPLYALALGLLATGFLIGSLFAWLESIPVRLEKTRQKRRIKTLEKELLEKELKAKDLHTGNSAITALPATAQNWTALPSVEPPAEPLEKQQ